MGQLTIRAFTDADRPWAERLLGENFGGGLQVRLGSLVDPARLSGARRRTGWRAGGHRRLRAEVGNFGIPIRDEIVLERIAH